MKMRVIQADGLFRRIYAADTLGEQILLPSALETGFVFPVEARVTALKLSDF